jgi:hypothetical protein
MCNFDGGKSISGLQSFHHVQAPMLARPSGCTHHGTFMVPGRPGRLRHAELTRLPDMSRDIATRLNRANGAAGLSPAGSRPCRLLRQGLLRAPVALLAFGVLWSIVHVAVYTITWAQVGSLAAAYRSGRCHVVEGDVTVLHEQPRHGHDDGDIVSIDGVVFEIDYFGSSGGYRQTIAHGGLLTDGAYVRVYYHDGHILRVDVGQERQAPE